MLITDEFMEAVRDGAEFEAQIARRPASVRATVDARALFQKLVETRLATGEPYIVFNRHGEPDDAQAPSRSGLKVSTSNLCSEITLPTGVDHNGQGSHRGLLPLIAQPRNLGRVEVRISEFIEDVMRFLDNVLQDYIDRAPDEHGARQIFGRARTLGRPWRDGLPQLPPGEADWALKARWRRSGTCKMFKHIQAKASEASMMLAQSSAALAPMPRTMGVMERFSCKMAIAPTASISIICGGTSACIEPIPANIYTHKTLSGSASSVKNAVSGEDPDREVEEFEGQRQCLELDPRAWRQRSSISTS